MALYLHVHFCALFEAAHNELRFCPEMHKNIDAWLAVLKVRAKMVYNNGQQQGGYATEEVVRVYSWIGVHKL